MNVLVNKKVPVQEKDFTRVRQHLATHLLAWYHTHVSTDGLYRDSMYQGLPEVAPITSDDCCSDNEKSYMTMSINAAMSLVSALSDEDGINEAQSRAKSIPVPVPTSIRGWPIPSGSTVASGTPSTSQLSALGQTILMDLAASRAEFELLKNHVSQLVTQCESQAQQIASAVQQQVTASLASQQQVSAPPPNAVTQDQLAVFRQS